MTTVSRVAVCRAGAMGSGIALVAAQSGATVRLCDCATVRRLRRCARRSANAHRQGARRSGHEGVDLKSRRSAPPHQARASSGAERTSTRIASSPSTWAISSPSARYSAIEKALTGGREKVAIAMPSARRSSVNAPKTSGPELSSALSADHFEIETGKFAELDEIEAVDHLYNFRAVRA